MIYETKESIGIVVSFTLAIALGLAFTILGQKYGFIKQGVDMTDEEKLAEEMVCIECSDDINRNYTHCPACTRCDDFIKGLTEGRKTQWHDLRKDPNDLPKQITLVIMYIIGNVYCNGWFNGDGWIIDNGNMKKLDCENIIAWCELPKFEE